MNYPQAEKGYITIIILITITISSIILFSFGALVGTQYTISQRQTAVEQSLQIAEAGLNYYRWHLAHAPNDFTQGTGQPGPYITDFTDPQGGVTGQYSIEVTPPENGSYIVTIQSTGWTLTNPQITRTITATYGRSSMAQYAFLHNSNIWLGSGLEIFGPVHSNGGIRNDAINHSLVTSSLDTYTCASDNGCSPSVTQPAVWGSGGDTNLWNFPQTPVDFNGISVNFAEMRTAAQSEGVYLGQSGNWGYRIIMLSDGTFNVYRVTNATNLRGYDNNTGGCQNLYQGISTQTLVGNYSQADNPIIFAEDTVWLEGTITHPIQVVAARFPIATNNMDIWINDNITYSNMNGSVRAGIIAQNNIYFARNLPNNFVLHGALLAQNGRIMRHHYNVSGCSPSATAAIRNSLTIFGAVISAQKSYWNWNSSTTLQSGFQARNITYDANLRHAPPPYFPTTGDYEFISWTE